MVLTWQLKNSTTSSTLCIIIIIIILLENVNKYKLNIMLYSVRPETSDWDDEGKYCSGHLSSER